MVVATDMDQTLPLEQEIKEAPPIWKQQVFPLQSEAVASELGDADNPFASDYKGHPASYR